jgi:tetratricopeptide (TPR) repeat protein
MVFREPVGRADGLKLAKQNRLREAEPLLEQAYDRRPDDVAVLRALAGVKAAAGKPKEAEAFLTQWCNLSPDDSEPFTERMKLRIDGRDFPNALRDGQHILERDPQNNDVRRDVAKMLFITGDITAADSECRRYLQSFPDDPEMCYLKADICHSEGNSAEAANTLDALLVRQPKNINALLLRGVIYNEMNESAKAIPLLQQVIERGPPSSQRMGAHNALMLALERTGRRSEAKQVEADLLWDQIQEIMSRKEHPKVAGLLLRMTETLITIGKAGDAVGMLEKDNLLDKIAEREPICIPEALRLLEKIIKEDPKAAPDARRLLADFYEKHGQKDKTESRSQ